VGRAISRASNAEREDRRMELKVTRLSVADRVATITLARPHRLNAWTGRMHAELRWCVATAVDDEDVRVLVITGEGRGFCAGGDSEALVGHRERGSYDDGLPAEVALLPVAHEFDHDLAWLLGLPKPVIAAVNGPAAGIGMALACFCDVRFASPEAKFTTAAPKLGLPAEYGLSWLLPRLIGAGRAADLLLSGRLVLADEAERIGLVNRVCADLLAHRVSPTSLRVTKHQLWGDLLHHDLGESIEESKRLTNELVGTAEFAEGSRALAEKRPPEF
jgi:enoyl-CoA hydratase/carnithine racemase